MAFPINPNDGDIYTANTGIRYVYSAAEDKWRIQDAYTLYGQTGSQGQTGAQGETGRGLQGETGIAGTTGIQGETGTQGNTGAQGLKGETGLDYGATGALSVLFDNADSALTANTKLDVEIPVDITIDSWRVFSNETGSILMGVWVDDYANFPPDSSDALHSGATGPYLLSTDILKREDTDLSDWNTQNVSAGQIMRINIDEVSTITRSTLVLKYHKT